MAGGDNPNIPSTRPLLRSVRALSSPERQNLAGAGASGDSNPITSPAMHETSAPQAAPWRSMGYAAEQRAGPSNPPSCSLPSGCMQAVPISIIVFHRRLTGRGSRPQIPVSRGCTPAPALPGVLEDGASIQVAGSNFLSLGRASNTAASHTVMNPSQSAIPDTCSSEHALRPNFLEDEASKTGNEIEATRLQQSETTNYCDNRATLESVVTENNLEAQVQHSQESTVLVAEGSADDNMHMYQPLWKRSKAQIRQSEYTTLSSPDVLKERTLTQIEMQISSAKKPETFRNEETPAQKQKARRKKHRPKVIREDKKAKVQKTVDSTPDGKSPQPKVKRSYVRKKRNVSPEKCSGSVSDQSISGGTRVAARRTASVRRSLQFGHVEQRVQGDHMLTANSQQQHHNIEKLVRAESSFCSVTESEVQVGHGPQVDMENSLGGLAFGMSLKLNKLSDEYIHLPEVTAKPTQEVSITTPGPFGKELTREQDNIGRAHRTDAASKNRFQIVRTPCIEENAGMIVAERSKKDLELNHSTSDDFPCSGRSLLDMDSTSQMSKVSTVENHTHYTNDESSGTGGRDSIILRTASKMLAFCRAGGIKKKRSSRIRRNSFISIMGLQNNTSQASTILPQQCMDALDESCYIKFITNKRSQKVSPQCSSTIEHNLELKNRLLAGSIFYDEYNGPKISEDKFSPWTLNSQRVDLDFHGKAPEESFTLDPEQSKSQPRYSWQSTRTSTSTVPYIDNLQGVSSKLQHLDLNTEQVHTSDMNSSLTMPSVICFGGIYDLSNALVPYGGRMVVPYKRPLRIVKRKRPRAKVDLDFETTRVWNLLMGNNTEPVDGTDVEKERWWQQEREVFQGRANSFIARMRLVQGDRRFSPWKGSVVDSVVGVFLTQNVADHLSSSAFMALAATFPSLSVNSSCKDTATQDNTQTGETECQRLKTVAVNGDVFGKSETSGPMMQFCSTIDCQQLDLRNEENISSTSPNSSSGSASPYLKDSKDEKANLLFTPCDSHVAERSITKTTTTVMYSCNTSTVLAVDHEKQTSFEASDMQENELRFVIDEMIAEPTRKDDECTLNSGFTSYDRVPDTKAQTSRPKKTKTTSKKNTENFDWDRLRRQVCKEGSVKERSFERRDSVDWEAVRCADVRKISHAIRERGMNNILAERIQNFLNRLVRDHGSIDLEWLRDIPPDSAKDFLLSIRGLGLKSVECVRLLTLHHLAFPVDTNVGRICVRLGWVPIQPLPESLQLHLLELYPVLETIQKYLWPRLCKLDQHTLYELHYHMITFGKVFCTKSKPNCNACPLRSECKHFASAFASARLALPAPQEKSLVKSSNQFAFESSSMPPLISSHLPRLEVSLHTKDFIPKNSEPIIEEPASPREEECPETMENDIEDFVEDDEIPTIKLNMEAFAQNLENCIKESNKELQSDDIAKALVAISNEAASIPLPKLKNVHRLRTEHYVYELPDSHPLVQQLELDQRELDDPSPYLLAIWTPGEVKEISNAPKPCCDPQVEGESCNNEMCHSCIAEREKQSRYVRGTILVPCRTAMRGSFPLNGTYFQVNEVFADHNSSHDPIHVERKHIWNLQRRMVLFGTSVPTIFKGLTTEEIQQCFWRGFVCVRGFDREFRTPRPLCPHLHVVARPRSRKTAATEQVH